MHTAVALRRFFTIKPYETTIVEILKVEFT